MPSGASYASKKGRFICRPDYLDLQHIHFMFWYLNQQAHNALYNSLLNRKKKLMTYKQPGSIDTTSRKSAAIEEKMFWKVTLQLIPRAAAMTLQGAWNPADLSLKLIFMTNCRIHKLNGILRHAELVAGRYR